MQLDDFLKAKGFTSSRFGAACGIPSKQTIHNYRHGIRFPSPENLRRIREASRGAVTAEDFVDQHVVTKPVPASSPLSTTREHELLSAFRCTDAQGQEMILRLARSLSTDVPTHREAAA